MPLLLGLLQLQGKGGRGLSQGSLREGSGPQGSGCTKKSGRCKPPGLRGQDAAMTLLANIRPKDSEAMGHC